VAEIVNLRAARKARARALAERHAEQNRRAFGRSKADKERSARETERLSTIVDGARREPD